MSIDIETVFRGRASSGSLLLSVLHAGAAGIRRALARRATRKALAHLGEAELKDIGLVRTRDGYRELHHDRFGASWWND